MLPGQTEVNVAIKVASADETRPGDLLFRVRGVGADADTPDPTEFSRKIPTIGDGWLEFGGVAQGLVHKDTVTAAISGVVSVRTTYDRSFSPGDYLYVDTTDQDGGGATWYNDAGFTSVALLAKEAGVFGYCCIGRFVCFTTQVTDKNPAEARIDLSPGVVVTCLNRHNYDTMHQTGFFQAGTGPEDSIHVSEALALFLKCPKIESSSLRNTQSVRDQEALLLHLPVVPEETDDDDGSAVGGGMNVDEPAIDFGNGASLELKEESTTAKFGGGGAKVKGKAKKKSRKSTMGLAMGLVI